MGACLSSKKTSSSSPSATTVPRNPSSVLSTFSVALSSTAQASTVVVPVSDHKPETKPRKQQQKPVEEHESASPTKKEVFLIKHRKSHDERERNAKQSLSSTSNPDPASEHDERSEVAVPAAASAAQIRTSSCTKEEVDAILIQCGRLSRSSSGKAASSSAGRRYSGSKRSFDFDSAAAADETSATTEDNASEKRVRERRRHSPSPQGRRRRTPSRERERENDRHHPQRSSSRERRVSRSPGRRNADPSPPESVVAAAVPASVAQPGKMVSVPALSAEKSGGDLAVKRVLVKRNAASPRAQSPAKAKPYEAPILSRSSSRKAEISPFRRNPLSEIDSNRSESRGRRESEGPNVNDDTAQVVQKPNSVTTHRSNKQQTQQAAMVEIDTKPQSLTRTRSARRSRDFDFNSEATNATPSYTRLLLEDINNFHQKNAPAAVPVTLPACVGKACSILEAVKDLNNSSNMSGSSSTFSEDRYRKTYNNLGGPKDPFLESEIGCDDLNEPSFHKYVTVRRGGGTAVEAAGDDQESSGSNSFVAGGSNGQLSGSGNLGLSPSSWEPNSADSTDCWTSRSREDNRLCNGGAKKRESGIGRGRLGAAKGLYPTPVVVVDSGR